MTEHVNISHDDGDPAHQPISDWDAIDPLWCSSRDIAEYESSFGSGTVPEGLKAAVMARESEAD